MYKLALILTILDSLPKTIFYLARLLKYYEVTEMSETLFKLWSISGWACPVFGLSVIIKTLILNRNALDTTKLSFKFTKELIVVVGVFCQVYQLVLFKRSLEKAKIQEREVMKALKEKQKQYKKKENNNNKNAGFHKKKN